MDIPEDFAISMPNLEVLDLNFNNLSMMSKDAFTSLQNLGELRLIDTDLKYHNLVSLTPLKELRILSLSLNPLFRIPENIFDNMTQLQILDIGFTGYWFDFQLVIERNAFSGQRESLLGLDLRYNWLKDESLLSLIQLENLTQLTLGHNRITKISGNSFRGMRQLTELDLEYNVIDTIEEDALINQSDSLQVLLLGKNQLGSDDLLGPSHLKYVEKVDLSSNDITTIPDTAFANMQDLKELDLSFNDISTISGLHPLEHVEKVDLSFNEISIIPDEAFSDMQQLKQLNLSDNKISTLNKTAFFNFTQIANLQLKGNRMVCDSNLIWMKEQENVANMDDWGCSYPIHCAGRKFANLTILDLQSSCLGTTTLPSTTDCIGCSASTLSFPLGFFASILVMASVNNG